MFIIAFGLLGLSLFAPMVAFANADLVPGDGGVVTGEAVLRTDPSFDAAAVATVPDGTTVSIIEGPITAGDGSLWYLTSTLDISGYLPVGAIATASPDTSSEETPDADVTEDAPATAETTILPRLEPVDYGVVVNNTAEALPESGLACRVAAMTDADIVTRMAEGTTLEITGDEVWTEGVSFYPVNCAGQGGFVRGEYVVLASAQPENDDVAVTEEAVTEEVATEAAVTEEPAPEGAPDATTGEGAPQEREQVSTGDLIVTLQGNDGMPVAGACFQLFAGESLVAEACDSADAIPDNGNSGFFGMTAGSYQLVAASLPGDSSIDNREVTIVAGERGTELVVVNSPVEDTTEDAATQDVEVTEEVADEFVAPEVVFLTEETPTEVVATDEVATDVASEVVETEEVATEEVATSVATEEVVTEEVATDIATEEVVATEAAATEPAVTEEVALADVATTAAAAPAGRPVFGKLRRGAVRRGGPHRRG